MKIALAEAQTLELIKKAVPSSDPAHYVTALKYIEMLPKMTEGNDNKLIVVPYEATSLVSTVASIKKIFEETK